MLDWSSAFDRQDPTLAIQKFLKIGVRPALVPVLASYLMDRDMLVKFNGKYSTTHDLPGGGPQGTLVGLIDSQRYRHQRILCACNQPQNSAEQPEQNQT